MDFLYFFDQFLDLDGPHLALLGPLLASLASGLTPSTRRNLVSTWSRPIFDQHFFRDLDKIVFGLSTLLISLRWPRNHHKKIRLENVHIPVSMTCQSVSSSCGGRYCIVLKSCSVLFCRAHCRAGMVLIAANAFE